MSPLMSKRINQNFLIKYHMLVVRTFLLWVKAVIQETKPPGGNVGVTSHQRNARCGLID